jgi:hypothetical protein
MYNRRKPHALFCGFICLSLLMAGTMPVWADDDATDDQKAEEKAEQDRLAAEQKRKAEEAKIKAEFTYSFNDISDKIVTIECRSMEGDKSFGSGFIAQMDGKTYVFTNQHVIMGASQISIKTTRGKQIIPRGVELSMTRDIARLPLAASAEGFAISDKPAIDMLLAVFGNSEGGGVATELYGKVSGVGSDLVEVTTEFVSGNSGSPALNDQQEVIGIVSYVRFYAPDSTTESDDQPQEKARRFCYRLSDVEWMPVNWKKYNDEYGSDYLEIESLVASIFDVVDGWVNDPFGAVPSEYRDYDLQKWAKSHNSMVKKIMRLSDQGSCTQKELDKTNKQISGDIDDSAQALSAFCFKKSRLVEMKLAKKDLTAFLRESFEMNMDALQYASESIDRFGSRLSTIDYFHFN